jgi:hypothetical protein
MFISNLGERLYFLVHIINSNYLDILPWWLKLCTFLIPKPFCSLKELRLASLWKSSVLLCFWKESLRELLFGELSLNVTAGELVSPMVVFIALVIQLLLKEKTEFDKIKIRLLYPRPTTSNRRQRQIPRPYHLQKSLVEQSRKQHHEEGKFHPSLPSTQHRKLPTES